MSFWGQVRELAMKDLRTEGRSGEVFLVTIPFGVLALFLIPLALPNDQDLLTAIGGGMFWVVLLLFGMTLTFRHKESVAQRMLIAMLGVDPVARFVARVISSTALLLAFSAILVPTVVVLYQPIAPPGWPQLSFVVVLVCLGLAAIGSLASDITAGLQSRTVLAPLLVAPLSVPLLVPAAQAAHSLSSEGSILLPTLITLFTLLGVTVIGVLTARSLEEASR